MCSWTDFLDSRPGTLPETRILSDATVLVIFSIAFSQAPAKAARMVLRFDQKGNMSAALQHDDVSAESLDEPLR